MQTQIWLLFIFVFAYLANHGWPWGWKCWWIPKSPIKVPSIVKCQIFTLQICSGWWGVPRGCRVPHRTHLCYRFWRHHHAMPWWKSILSSRGEQIFIWIIHWPPVFQSTFQKHVSNSQNRRQASLNMFSGIITNGWSTTTPSEEFRSNAHLIFVNLGITKPCKTM